MAENIRDDHNYEESKMKRFHSTVLLVLGTVFTLSNVMANESKKFIVMQRELTEIKSDFNESVDEVRLLFIISPT